VELTVDCPSCGESVTLWVDSSGGTEQRYVEDCEVCCRPMEIVVQLTDQGDASLDVRGLDA
jgi:hypothetical protein